jgi:PTS system nitrogen regulatory IIA component
MDRVLGGEVKITVREAARLLDVSEKTVYRWIEQRKLPVHRINDQYRFNRAELLEWATAQRVPLSVEIFQEPQGDPLPALSEALATGGIHYRVHGSSRDEALRQVVSLMHLPEEVDRDFLFQMLVARETLGSTGVGDGIAIPHVRNPVVLHVRPVVTLCFLEQPVDFGAIDGVPVRALFALVSPTIRAHLHLLSRLGAALHDGALKRLVAEQGGREEILAAFRRVEAGFAAASVGAGAKSPPAAR